MIEVQDEGPPDAEPLLLIMGLGMPLVATAAVTLTVTNAGGLDVNGLTATAWMPGSNREPAVIERRNRRRRSSGLFIASAARLPGRPREGNRRRPASDASM